MPIWISDKPSCFPHDCCPSHYTWNGYGAVWALGDNDMVTAGHMPGHLHLFCAGTAQSVPVSDPLALTAEEMPPVTERAPL